MKMYKLIKDYSGGYLYSTVKNRICSISDAVYEIIQTENVSSNNEEYRKLLDDGWLEDAKVDFSYPVIDCLNSILNRKISNLILQLTQGCNLRCKYCAYSQNDGNQRLHTAKDMSKEIAFKAIDFLKEHSSDCDVVNIGFYGGEPFVNFDLMKDIIIYAEKILEGKDLLFLVTTNGTLITRTQLDFLNKHDVAITISLDGPKSINDKNRLFADGFTGSFDRVKKSIQLIVNEYSRLRELLSINMVLDTTIPYMEFKEIFQDIPEARRLKIMSSMVSNDSLETKYPVDWKFVEGLEYQKFLFRMGEYDDACIVNMIDNVSENSFRQGFEQSKQLMDITKQVASPSGPCIPGYTKLFVNIYGDYYPCEKVSELASDLRIGNIDTGLSKEKISNLIRLPEITKEECSRCWAYKLCGSCAKYSIDYNRISAEQRLRACDGFRREIELMLLEYGARQKFGV